MAWIEIQNKDGKKIKISKGAYDIYYKDNEMYKIVSSEKEEIAKDVVEPISEPSSNIKEEKKEIVENVKIVDNFERNTARKSPKKNTV